MLCADDLVRSGRVMVAFLDGPSAGLILEVFVVDGTAILHFNLGLVRIGPQLFVFAFGRSLRRAFRRPNPATTWSCVRPILVPRKSERSNSRCICSRWVIDACWTFTSKI